ncbi:MAG: SDR family oxidoreductase [Verrucomicrobiales bacterium]|nr:SDR family oxidoreductase [Verrucomicrobiales bacterium]
MDFKDKIAVITGGASGIGRAVALALAREGADIVVADLNEARMAEVQTEVAALGRRVLTVRCDVSRDGDVDHLAETALRGMGRVDILHNNAGVQVGGPIEKIPMPDWEWILGINVLGPIRGVRAFLPHMLERGSGYIINTGSLAGLFAHKAAVAPYITSKFALLGFSEALALYARPRGIGVSVVCPGVVRTHFHENTRRIAADGSRRRPDTNSVTTPQANVLEADEIAAKVLAGVREERFLILTHSNSFNVLQVKSQDIEAFIRARIRAQEEPIQ